MKLKNKNAFSLIEVLLILSIILILSISSFFAFKKTQETRIANNISNELLSIKSASDLVFQSERTYSRINEERLIDTGFIPDYMIRGKSIYSANGNHILVTKSPGNNDLRYNLLYENVSSDYCIKVVSIVHSFNYAITVSKGGVSSEIKHDNADREVGYSIAKAVAKCGNGEKVSVMFQSLE